MPVERLQKIIAAAGVASGMSTSSVVK